MNILCVLPSQTLISSSTSGECLRPFVTFANNLDPDEAPLNIGPHLRPNMFDKTAKVLFGYF